jgi:nicotinamide phosphoribosyltransferase
MKLTDEQIRDVAEFATFRKFLLDNPTGIISLVSDTFDLFKVITEYLPKLKDIIMSRDGKLVIRPDSGDPVDILCGDYNSPPTPLTAIDKGVIELLWDIFGGTVSSTGYKVLDSHIGAIYGDSINYDRAQRIFERLEAKGFASTNVVLGIGSYSLAFVTRDTHGSAQKATYIEVNGIGIEIFKDPITDVGVKKSAKGLLQVYEEDDVIKLKDQCTWEEEGKGLLQVIFEDGKFYNLTTLTRIREKLNN